MIDLGKPNFDQIINYVNNRVSIVDVYLQMHGNFAEVKPSYGGSKQENVSCPWHGYRGDRRGSATVYPESNKFYCHACGEKPYDVITFVRKYQGSNYFAALKYLEETFNFKIPAEIKNDFNEDDRKDLEGEVRKGLYNIESGLKSLRFNISLKVYLKMFDALDSIESKIETDSIFKVKQMFDRFQKQYIKLRDKIKGY